MTEPPPVMVNAYDGSRADDLPPATRELIRRREHALGRAYRLFYDQPVSFTRAAGVHLYDAEGNAYLDAYNNVPSVGHCHPHVTQTVARQVATLNTHTRYLTDPVVSYAERLLATHDLAAAANAIFTCTGSEANDLALRIARHHTGAAGIVVTANAYHGVTAALAELSPSLGPNIPLAAHVRAVPAPAPGLDFTAAVTWAITDLRRHGHGFAAFLADSIFSSDGVRPDPAGYLAPVADAVHQAGGLYIADEVQAGFARTGTHMWGYQRHGLRPDIVTMGKPMGNGLPIAALIARHDILDAFGSDVRYFNTFGGNPVSIAAAAAVLDILETDRLPVNAATTGAYLKDTIARLAAGTPLLGDVRGTGLYLGIDVNSPSTGEPSGRLASAIVNAMRERRVLISATGPHGSVLKIRPPLPFAPEHADQLGNVLADVLTAAGAAAGPAAW